MGHNSITRHRREKKDDKDVVQTMGNITQEDLIILPRDRSLDEQSRKIKDIYVDYSKYLIQYITDHILPLTYVKHTSGKGPVSQLHHHLQGKVVN